MFIAKQEMPQMELGRYGAGAYAVFPCLAAIVFYLRRVEDKDYQNKRNSCSIRSKD